MRTFKDFNEIKAAVGAEIGVSEWMEVTQERINRFAEATGDEQWIHVDVKRAKQELPIQTTIAHGLLTVSLVPEFVRSVMGLQGIKNTLNYVTKKEPRRRTGYQVRPGLRDCYHPM